MLSRAAAHALWLCIAVAVAAPAAAQSTQDLRSLIERVERLQRELNTLQGHVYRGGAPEVAGTALPPGAPGPSAGYAAQFELRLTQLETELRNLTGRIEEVSFGVDEIKSRLDKLVADVDFRLSALEGGRPAGAPSAKPLQGPAATPVPAPSPPAVAVAPAPSRQSGAASPLPPGTRKEQYDYAFLLLRRAQYDKAEDALRAFVEAYPEDELAGNAQYWLGETYYVRGEYEEASVHFLRGYRKYADSPKGPDNLLKLGMSLASLGKTDEACAAWSRLAEEFPSSPKNVRQRAARERQRLGCR